MSYLRYLCLFAHSGVQHMLCCVFALFLFVLCFVYLMLPVSVGCLRLVPCVPYVASFSGFSFFDCIFTLVLI